MRVLIVALMLVLAPAADAQESARTREQAGAFLIHKALAPAAYDWSTRWDSVSVRLSRHMHWHIFEPDPRDRPADAIVRRNGWIEGPGYSLGVSAFGGDETVTELSLEFTNDVAGRGEALLAALAQEGVAAEIVHNEGDRGEYRLSAPERRDATLTRVRSCSSPMSRAAHRCWTVFTLRFEPIS